MKFQASHKIDLHNSISKNKLALSDFNFSKKRGRIIILNNRNKTQFSYIQKLEKEIDMATGQWKEQDDFEIVISGSKKKASSWSEVISAFETWLIF